MYTGIVEGNGVSVGVWECPHREPGWCEGVQLGLAEVVVPLQGAYVQDGSAGQYFASPATATLGSPGDEYRVRHPVGGGDRAVVFLLEESALEDLGRGTTILASGDRLHFRTASVQVAPTTFIEIHRFLALLGSGIDSPVGASCGIAAMLEHLLVPVAKGDEPSRPSPSPTSLQRKAVTEALEFMADAYGSRLTLGAIASAVGYSPFHFARLFKAITGSTVHDRLTELRLRNALHRIREGEANLTAVALGAGFSSHSHFTASFRARFGLTPSDARMIG